ncbi:MAG TPA: DedA family protein [Candidatus Rubrimentiphilum sp.]|nr:DedA family protein [Candidatus Rubrimentiphilum sp.]
MKAAAAPQKFSSDRVHAFSQYFLHLIDQFGYLGLYVVMTLANIGAPVGSEIVLPAAGALAATGHLSSVWLTIAVALAGELTGQSIGYAVGRFGGRPFVDRFGKYVRFHHAELQRVDSFFARWGSFAIFICRFVPFIRGIMGVPAGIAEMPLAQFYFWTFCGSLIFCGGFVLAGSALGSHAQAVGDAFRHYALLIVGVVVVALVVYLIVRNRSARKTV